jgi:hypothetical protein
MVGAYDDAAISGASALLTRSGYQQLIERGRRKLAQANDGDQQMVNIPTMVLSDGLPAVEVARAVVN